MNGRSRPLFEGEVGGRAETTRINHQQHTMLRRTAFGEDPHGQGTLRCLPRELRNEIYKYLLSSGELSILRTSHQLSLEALELLYTHGIFRMYVNSGKASRNIQPEDYIVRNIRNLELRWDLSDCECERNSRKVLDFCWIQQEARMVCHVILEFGALRAALLTAFDIFALQNLRVFRKVLLETAVEDSTAAIGSGRLARGQQRTLSILNVLTDELRLELGPADQRGDADEKHLVFQPSRNLAI